MCRTEQFKRSAEMYLSICPSEWLCGTRRECQQQAIDIDGFGECFIVPNCSPCL
jgi:hypothetical protein